MQPEAKSSWEAFLHHDLITLTSESHSNPYVNQFRQLAKAGADRSNVTIQSSSVAINNIEEESERRKEVYNNYYLTCTYCYSYNCI